MANGYYDNSDAGQRFQPGTTARGSDVDEKFDQIQQGFAKLPTPSSQGAGFADPVFVGAATQDDHAVSMIRAAQLVADGTNATIYDANATYEFGETVIVPEDLVTYRWISQYPGNTYPVDDYNGVWQFVGGGKGGVLGQASVSMSQNQTIEITLSADVEAPIVSATKEVVDTGVISSVAEVASGGVNYSVEDFAYNTSLTPSDTDGAITLSLGTGSFNPDHVGLLVKGNGGVAVVTATDGAAVVKTPFNSTTTISAGDWVMSGINFTATDAALASRTVGVTSGSSSTFNSSSTGGVSAVLLDNGNVMEVYADIDNNQYATVVVLSASGSVVSSPSVFDSSKSLYFSPTLLGSGDVMVMYGKGSNPSSAAVAVLSPTGSIVASPTVFDVSDIRPISSVLLGSGDVFSTYRGDGNSYNLKVALLSASGSVTNGPVDLGVSPASDPVCVLLDNGNVLVTYEDQAIVVSPSGSILEGPNNVSLFTQDALKLPNGNVFIIYKDEVAVLSPLGVVMDGPVTLSPNMQSPRGVLLDDGNVLIVFRDADNSGFGSSLIVSQALDLLHGPAVFNSESTINPSPVLLSDGKVMTCYPDSTSSYGTSVIISALLGYPDILITAVTNSNGQADSEFWTDITDATVTDEPGTHTIGYAWQMDSGDFTITQSGQGSRRIVRKDSGEWQYNADNTYTAETWVTASRQSELGALSDAGGIPVNIMTSADIDALSASEYPATGDTLDTAIIMVPVDNSSAPTSRGIAYTYDTNALQTLAVPGTDYEWDYPDSSKIRFTALTAMNTRVRVN